MGDDTKHVTVTTDRLNLGCGSDIRDGWMNLDIVDGEGVDLVCDISEGLPFPADSFRRIAAVDVVEHVPQDKCIHLMNEVHRVLREGGVFEIHVPEAPGITAFQDPTHVSYWNSESFDYYRDGHRRRERYGVRYGVSARFRIGSMRRRRHQWRRFFTSGNPAWLSNFVLDVELVAIK